MSLAGRHICRFSLSRFCCSRYRPELAGSCHSLLPLSNGAQICEIGSREDPVLRPMAVTHIVRGGSGATNGEIKHSPASPAGPLQCIPYLNIHLQMIYDKIQPIYLH